ncbi:MAG: hypothetical protein C7B46_08055 [Sulfobacillus benefaciens]|uniref:Glycoside hydrolase family 38 central domain-containing protein n=1 Tax=Sulfobacillus benefaciens TaxID=453960 RepID=A0A2T2XH13_9FIRM|nr:MAG: hypothetical protein C7B46_08055 [Sulfobacillus benefaciens]
MTTHYQYWLNALKFWSIIEIQPITTWDVTYATGETYGADPHWQEWRVANAAQRTLTAYTQAVWPNARIRFDLAGESLVRINGQSAYGVNDFHRSFEPKVASGERFKLEVDQVTTGLMGQKVSNPGITAIRWEKVDKSIERTYWDLAVLAEWMSQTELPASLVHWLQRQLDHALTPLYSLSPDAGAQGHWVNREQRPAEEEALFRHLATGREVPGLYQVEHSHLIPAIDQVSRELTLIYEQLRQKAPGGFGRILLLGHAHIDLAWLWPLPETMAKIRRTVASQRYLLDQFPQWRFGMSSPEMWQLLEEHDPQQYRDWAIRAKSGQVVPLGAFWVESDSQLVSAETIIRHLLYGLRYFERITGQRPQIAFLPDTFGFAEGLPTLLAHAGIRLFLTTKINWNDTTPFPYKHFRWIGPDGSSIQAQIFGSSPDGYNGKGSLSDLKFAWSHYAASEGGNHTVLYTLGHGDGGGGPDEDMLQRISRYHQLPLVPELSWALPDTLILPSDDTKSLPIYQGELYLQYHRGVFTSQTAVKQRFRQTPNRIAAAEAWLLESGIHDVLLNEAWRLILRNSFHDILPGSSIATVYQDFHRDLDTAEHLIEDAEDLAISRIFAPSAHADDPVNSLVVGNRSGFSAPPQLSVVSLDYAPEIFFDGKWHNGYLIHPNEYLIPLPALPPMGLVAIPMRQSNAPNQSPSLGRATEPLNLTTVNFSISISCVGIVSLRYRDQELLKDPASIIAFFQHPEQFDAWELVTPEKRGPLEWTHEPLCIVEDNPYRTVVQLRHHVEHSAIMENIVVDHRHGSLLVKISAELNDRHLTLQYRVPTNINALVATAETLWGTTTHPTVSRGPQDAAEFEWVAHRFVDVAEPHRGLALLNDGRYGHSVNRGEIRVTLVTTPLYPDPTADQHMAPVTLALMPHHQHWTDAGVMKAAHALSHPPRITVKPIARINSAIPLEGLCDNIALLAFKPAEDGSGDYIVHLGEMWGDTTDLSLGWPRQVTSVWPIDVISEKPIAAPVALESHVTPVHIKSRGFIALRAHVLPSDTCEEKNHGL